MRRLFTLVVAVPILYRSVRCAGDRGRGGSLEAHPRRTACLPPPSGRAVRWTRLRRVRLQTCSFVSVQVFDGTTRFREGGGQPTTTGSLACVNLFSAVISR